MERSTLTVDRRGLALSAGAVDFMSTDSSQAYGA